MKRIVATIVLFLALAGSVMIPALASAQTDPYQGACNDPKTQASPVCQATGEDPISGSKGVLSRVVTILSWVVGVASVIMVILGGLKYVTSNGDPNAISGAKNTILYAVIGIIVFALSQTIVIFVINKV